MNVKRALMMVALIVLCSGVAMGQTEWVNHPGNPVLEPGETGEWDAAYREVGAVVWDGAMYHMMFTADGEDPDDYVSIGHATSPDGVTWTMDPANPVMTAGAEGTWDDNYLFAGSLIIENGEFHLWYSGHDGEIERVGYATSPDGSVWTKYSGNPVMDVGPAGSFDERGMWPSSVVASGDTYRMWFTGVDSGRFWTIGFAESTDKVTWNKRPTPVLVTGPGWESWDVWTPSVVFDGSIYHMWYSGSQAGIPTGIGYATSGDGIEWAKYEDNPVIPSADLWASSCEVVLDESTLHMWYHRWDGEEIYLVSYATSNCCVARNFRQTVPAAALASGAQGSFYQTDLDLNNPGIQAVEYEFTWLPRGENNSEPMTSETFTLGAGMSVRYTNVLAEVFGLEPNALGAFSIQSSSPDLLCMSRTYNLELEKSGGTFGQAIPAVKPGEFITHGERRRILFGSQGPDYRTNIGCINGLNMLGAVEIEFFNAEGESLKTERLRLDPWSNDQLNAPFSDYAPVNGYVDIWTVMPNGSFFCYGSVLDNVTSDPTTILPK